MEELTFSKALFVDWVFERSYRLRLFYPFSAWNIQVFGSLRQVSLRLFGGKCLLHKIVDIVGGGIVQIDELVTDALVLVPITSFASDCWLNHLPLLIELLLLDAPPWSSPNSWSCSLVWLVWSLQEYIPRLLLKIRLKLFDGRWSMERGIRLSSAKSFSKGLLLL